MVVPTVSRSGPRLYRLLLYALPAEKARLDLHYSIRARLSRLPVIVAFWLMFWNAPLAFPRKSLNK